MTKKIFSSPLLVCFTLFSPTVILAIPFVLFCVSDTIHRARNLIILLVLHLILNLIIFWFYSFAFSIVSLDEKGIKARNLQLKWDEIGSVKTETVELFKYSLCPTLRMDFICISKENETWSFFQRNKKCILMSKTDKNLKLLAKYSNGVSNAIKEYLQVWEIVL